MISLEQPSIALNDFRATATYHMWRSLPVRTAETSRSSIMSLVKSYAITAPGGTPIKNLVINCHGFPAYLQMGEGFQEPNLRQFLGWNGLFETIWITGCLVGRHPNRPVPERLGNYSADGQGFCSRLAHYTNAHVIASTEVTVSVREIYPYGSISDLEGRVTLYQAGTGIPVAWARNTSRWQDRNGGIHGAGEAR